MEENEYCTDFISNEASSCAESSFNTCTSVLSSEIDTSSTTSDSFVSASNPVNHSRTKSKFNVLLSNARSLLPKIECLVDHFRNLELSSAIITESWLRPGVKLDEELEDFEWGEKLKVFHRSRKTRSGRSAGGGVAIILSLIHI